MATPKSQRVAARYLKARSHLLVRTNAYHGGINSPKGIQVTISVGSDDITASMDEWRDAIDQAQKEIRQAEYEW